MREQNKTSLHWLYTVPGRKKGYILLLTLLQALQGGSGVLYALLLRGIVDSAVKGNHEAFRQSVVLIILLTVGQICLQILVRWLNELTRATFENLLKQRQIKYLLQKNYASVSAIHSGEWLNRLTNDTVVVTTGYVEILPGLVGTLVRMLSALIVLFTIDRVFALVLIPGGIGLIAVTSLFRKVLKRLHKRMQEKDGKLRIFLQERISSLMMIKSFTAEKQTARDADRYMQEHKDARMRKNYFSNFCNTGLAAALEGLYLFGVIYCAWGILAGTLSYGTLAAVMQLLSQIRAPLVSISGYLPKYYAMQASAERLMEVEKYPDDLQGKMIPAESIGRLYRDKLVAFGLHNAEYTYNQVGISDPGTGKERMPVVLHNFNLEIRKGEYVAFTGHSGCGKSTVLKLLMCMYPLDGGTLTFLEKDGKVVPLTAEHRRLFAYVPQGNHLMTGTIRDAVSFSGREYNDMGRIAEALWIACAYEFIDKLKDGIDTQLGERGTGLSEGQMQRIAIARALYSDAPILLLDEATSALDAATEEKLLFNLKTLTDKTVIIVTHRPAALEICDRVLEFTENGVIEKNEKEMATNIF